MLKQIFMGILWFIAFWLALTIVFMIVVGVLVTSTTSPMPTDYDEGVKAGLVFAQAHVVGLTITRLLILLAALLAAVVGTVKGTLPGTRKPAD
jgi:hypothetical protein